ncbi:MAG: hypothetical protein IT537_24970 [Hyphomicrobiales bacterium]|nr:hypothetical protein [Hyphomicrobiales bacterium]
MVGIAKCASLATCVLIASLTGALAQSPEVGHVTSVEGYVFATAAGRLVRLDFLDGIPDRTKVEVRANSELELCHHVTHTLMTLTGPASAVISMGGLTTDNTAAFQASDRPCSAPKEVGVQGGLLTRGIPKAP